VLVPKLLLYFFCVCHSTCCVGAAGQYETPDGKPVADLAANVYTLEQFRQKAEQDKLLANAELNKQEVRGRIASLRSQVSFE
jgi:hypothetical protein